MHKNNPFNKGTFKDNFAEVFGRDRNNWFIPVDPQLTPNEDLFIAKNY